ncbi:MAG: hypothetical protein AAGC73_04210 [Verrucomicrobiota bacterium]
MNKTLMLVICDFLLLSMLALARFDPPEERPEPTLDATASSDTAEAELISLLEESLESELESRTSLSEDLTETRQSLQEKAVALEEKEAALNETQESLEAKAAEAARLAQTKAELEAEQTRLAAEKLKVETEQAQLSERFESTRTELQTANTERVELVKTVGSLKAETSVVKERLSQTEEELIAREIALAEREAALKAAEEERQRLAKEADRLSRQLDVAQAERTLLSQNLARELEEKQLLQAEKEQAFARADRLGENVSQLGQGVNQLGQNVSQIGEGVTNLNETSETIRKEMEDARPQTMSEIFTRFQNNRALIKFTSTETGLLGGEKQRTYETKSILITDTANGGTFLVTHSSDTPFTLSKAGKVTSAALEVTLGQQSFAVRKIAFFNGDPRLIFIPLPELPVQQSGFETFKLSMQPERWEEAILIKNDETNFGRAGFRRLTSSARFLKMDRPALGQLFANFASSRGDLAFTKNSYFIGALTDSKHAFVIDGFLAGATLELGPNYDPANASATIGRLNDRLSKLPAEVQ